MKGPGLLVGLIVSIALNLFLIGLGVGAWALGPRLMQPPPAIAQGPGRRPLPVWALGRSLSPEHRPAFNAVLRKALQATAADIREARAIKRRVFDEMSDGEYDAAAVSAELDRARALEFSGRQRVERDVIAFSATLPPEERANLAEGMRAAMNPITRRFQTQWDRPAAPPPAPE